MSPRSLRSGTVGDEIEPKKPISKFYCRVFTQQFEEYMKANKVTVTTENTFKKYEAKSSFLVEMEEGKISSR